MVLEPKVEICDFLRTREDLFLDGDGNGFLLTNESLRFWQVSLLHEVLLQMLLVLVHFIIAFQNSRATLWIEAVGVSLNIVVSRIVDVHWHRIVVAVEHAMVHQDAVVDRCLGNLENAVVIIKVKLATSLCVGDEQRVDEESSSERVVRGRVLELSIRKKAIWICRFIDVVSAILAFILLGDGCLCARLR